MKSKVLRLLTFICFFQFSGINNGYSALQALSPLDAKQSASCVSLLVVQFQSAVRPDSRVPPLETGHRWIVFITLQSEKALQNIFKSTGELSPSGAIAQSLDSESETRFGDHSTFSLYKQVSYIKLEKKSWLKSEKYSAKLGVGRLVFVWGTPRDNGIDIGLLKARAEKRFDAVLKRMLCRRFGNNRNGEGAQKFNINEESV